MNHEDLLRETLRAKADDAPRGPSLDDIRRRATRHTARRRVLVGLAAAAVVAITVPTALLLRPSDEPGPAPSPSPSPSLTTSSPSGVPTPSGLETIPRGPAPRVTYLQNGVIHEPDGSTSRLPAAATDVVAFTPYHGGWIVLDSVGGLTEYDNTGAEVLRSVEGESALAVSPDLMRTAFQLGGKIMVGISTGMGEGETTHVVGPDSRLAGFLGDRVVYSTGGTVRAVDGAGKETVVPGLSQARATSPDGDLVAGAGAGQGDSVRVVSASTGRVLWTKAGWFAAAFSPDGRYLAAYRSATGGEFETVGILDAHTGAVVATSETPGVQALPSPPTAWEEGDRLLIPYRGGSSWALLRLSAGGAVDRATELVTGASESAPFVFARQP